MTDVAPKVTVGPPTLCASLEVLRVRSGGAAGREARLPAEPATELSDREMLVDDVESCRKRCGPPGPGVGESSERSAVACRERLVGEEEGLLPLLSRLAELKSSDATPKLDQDCAGRDNALPIAALLVNPRVPCPNGVMAPPSGVRLAKWLRRLAVAARSGLTELLLTAIVNSAGLRRALRTAEYFGEIHCRLSRGQRALLRFASRQQATSPSVWTSRMRRSIEILLVSSIQHRHQEASIAHISVRVRSDSEPRP